jgi:hypothetical protein
MALFTDGSISTLEQLAAQDTAVLDAASTEGIDATAKLSLAQEELGIALTSAFSRSALAFGNPSAWWPGSSVPSRSLQLQHIVVTSPLRLWHTFHTLELIYRDAYNSQLNDRYFGKWNEYKDLARWAADMLFQIGVGLVSVPVPMAQTPALAILSGPFPATTYFVQIAWLNSRGEEGLASQVASASGPDQNTVQVMASPPPVGAALWNVYVGSSIDGITRQNNAPLDPSQAWIQTSSGLSPGKAPGTGQDPNFLRQIPRFLQRG